LIIAICERGFSKQNDIKAITSFIKTIVDLMWNVIKQDRVGEHGSEFCVWSVAQYEESKNS
jgi:hypothetical protein